MTQPDQNAVSDPRSPSVRAIRTFVPDVSCEAVQVALEASVTHRPHIRLSNGTLQPDPKLTGHAHEPGDFFPHCTSTCHGRLAVRLGMKRVRLAA
jgi:hypothetical protein